MYDREILLSCFLLNIYGQQFHHPSDYQDHHDHQHQVLHNDINKERSHLQEHMDVPTRDVNDMSQDELLFHYFKMMDVDKNARLDGTELVASIIHYSSHSHGAHGHSHNELLGKIFSDEEFSTQIDPVLANDDLNKDGYIDYPEFILAQQKTDIKVSVS